MTSILHQLQPYMFNNHSLANFKDTLKKSLPGTKCENNKSEKEATNVFVPKYKDTLFWCFYIMIKGWDAFYLVGRNSFSIEKRYLQSSIKLDEK